MQVRICIIAASESQTWVREAHNRNEHPQINVYFRAAGYKRPELLSWTNKAWCATFVTWCLKQCNVPISSKNSLAAVATYNGMASRRIIPGSPRLPGDVVTYRVWSHVELVKYWPLDPRIRSFYANGGNTSGGRKQHGAYANISRPKAYVRYVLRFVPIQ